MKQLIKLSLVSVLALSNSVFALNPVQGLYGGLIGEVSGGPSSHPIRFTRDNMDFVGDVKYNTLGGGGGAVLGYRIQKFRVEGEILYNRIAYDTLTVGSCIIQSPNVLTPIGVCPQDAFQKDALGFNGSSSAIYGLFNGYFDFVTYESDNYIVPYVGLGIGGAKVKNSRNFVNTNTLASRGNSNTSTSAAVQGILGISFYLDDFTWAGMDYRYLTTNSLEDFGNKRYAVNTLNFNLNFSFDNS